jgi:hypothetical protein
MQAMKDEVGVSAFLDGDLPVEEVHSHMMRGRRGEGEKGRERVVLLLLLWHNSMTRARWGKDTNTEERHTYIERAVDEP